MYEEAALQCWLCNKLFDNQSTLKRHGYYCRSRRIGITVRPRACVSCARGKARCDHRRPKCTRCVTKATECSYPAKVPKGASPRIQQRGDAPTRQTPIALQSVDCLQGVANRQASTSEDVLLDSALDLFDPEIADLGMYLDWETQGTSFDEFPLPESNDEANQTLLLGTPYSPDRSTVSTSQPNIVQRATFDPNALIIPITMNKCRYFLQRARIKSGAQRIAKLIFHTLISFPRTMSQHNNLPSFIHPCLMALNVEDNSMEPLANCISLVHMISSEVQGSRKLFWKHVRMECEHIYEEHRNFSKLGLLAAMQALSIYILIRMGEGETDSNNYDALLIAAVGAIATRLKKVDTACNPWSTPYNPNPKTSWKDWIFDESRQRLAVVYRVINMLVHFETGEVCKLQRDLILAPLPEKKQLWEATDEASWKAESERGPGIRNRFGLAANGELVKLDKGQRYCGDTVISYKSLDAGTPARRNANWEEWCSGMDGFGGLVMLAASLVE